MIPTNSSITTNGCDNISSNCVIWQGPDIACIDLCSGDTISEVTKKIADKVAKYRAETFEAGGWKVTCSKCGVSGHNKATCGKKSKPQYVRKTVKKEDVRKNEFLKATGAILIGVIMGRFL